MSNLSQILNMWSREHMQTYQERARLLLFKQMCQMLFVGNVTYEWVLGERYRLCYLTEGSRKQCNI
jgi:hypothetical protein